MNITFYASVDRSALNVVGFYKQDIDLLKELGYEVKIATKYHEINWRSDVIFIWWWTYALFPVVVGRLLGKKVIITGTFNYKCPGAPNDFYRRNFIQRILIKSAMKFATNNILVSKNEFILITNDWNFKNLSYSPHIVDTSKYSYNQNRESNLIFSIIWTGKQNLIRKCLPEIIQTALILSKKAPQIKFIIAGRRGDGYEEIKNYIRLKNLERNIMLVGEISEEEKIRYLQTCTIYLQPSTFEGFGVAIAEAMACGAPVISSNTGELPYLIGDSGILVNENDPELISNEILNLLKNNNLRFELGRKANYKINKEFYWNRRKTELKKIIEDK